MPVAALFGIGAFDQRTACRFGAVRRRQPGQGQMVAALIVFAFAEEGGTAFLVDEPRRGVRKAAVGVGRRSEEHTSELQSLMRISYAVFCLKKKKNTHRRAPHTGTSRQTTYV